MKKTNNTIKLTVVQQNVINDKKREIDYARSCNDIYDYAIRNYCPVLTGTATDELKAQLRAKEQAMMTPAQVESMARAWENAKQGIVRTVRVNSKTLLKLEELGLIEVIELMSGAYGVDMIRILNY